MHFDNNQKIIDKIYLILSFYKYFQLKCPDCPKFLATQQSLRMHIFTHIPEIDWPYECEYCQKRFKMRSDLPKHFNSILHRHDPEIPDKDTNEYYAILDRSFTKPDPTQYLFSLIEEVPTIIECPVTGRFFVPGPGYDQHIQVGFSLRIDETMEVF